jgi:hypothetical protein
LGSSIKYKKRLDIAALMFWVCCFYFPISVAPKKRASTYEPKVKFKGSFEDMIAISTIVAGVKKKKQSNEKGNR